MYGNDRMYLATNTMTTLFKTIMEIWYANPMGEEQCMFSRKKQDHAQSYLNLSLFTITQGCTLLPIEIRYITFRTPLYSRSC